MLNLIVFVSVSLYVNPICITFSDPMASGEEENWIIQSKIIYVSRRIRTLNLYYKTPTYYQWGHWAHFEFARFFNLPGFRICQAFKFARLSNLHYFSLKIFKRRRYLELNNQWLQVNTHWYFNKLVWNNVLHCVFSEYR